MNHSCIVYYYSYNNFYHIYLQYTFFRFPNLRNLLVKYVLTKSFGVSFEMYTAVFIVDSSLFCVYLYEVISTGY